MSEEKPNSGSYILCLWIPLILNIRVGSLGSLSLKPGLYLYAGSGRRNLRQRINRHFAAHKKVRWHIDYLTTHPMVQIKGAILNAIVTECALSKAVMIAYEATPVPGFGSSDCRYKCQSHLYHLDKPIEINELIRVLAAVLGLVGDTGFEPVTPTV